MPELRLACYVVGLLMSLILSGQLLRIRHSLARLLAVAMGAWTVNCISLFLLLFFAVSGEPSPSWRDMLMTVNALLLAAIPVLLYGWFLKVNGTGDHG